MAKAAKTGQTIFLVVLLAGLAFMVIRMFNSMNPPKAPEPKAKGSVAAKEAGTKGTPDATASKPSKGSQNIAEDEKVLKDQYLNPNLFRTYELETTRNPFVQQESWYADYLSENFPGYPELKDSDFFESMDAYLPDIDFIYDGEHEWSTAQVSRSQSNNYSISGTSKDGLITTTISLESDIPTIASLNWSKYSQVPLETLSDPEAARRYNVLAVDKMGDPLSENLFGDPPAGGLGVPGMVSPDGSPAEGDIISCSGISFGYGRTAALLTINGNRLLVSDGSYIASRYQVLEIKTDGVVLVELKSGSSQWIPLGGN